MASSILERGLIRVSGIQKGVVSVYNLRHIRPMSSDTFLVS